MEDYNYNDDDEIDIKAEPIFDIETSERKCNLSLSFNFDDEKVESETSSTSFGLQINVEEVKNDEKPAKRQRIKIEDESVLNEVEEEIERQLDAKAAKTNLTARNVKNILKHVITNEHVLNMVQNSISNLPGDAVFEPKLTRAKAKELAMVQPNIPWSITPSKKSSSSEVQALIEQDLPEDSSDEEYYPNEDEQDPDQDLQSEEEQDVSINDAAVDLSTSTAHKVSSPECTLKITQPLENYSMPNEVITTPGAVQLSTLDESIGQRTRSKLSLSETPLEQIEQAFIPPDISVDMYDSDCDPDEEWSKFLTEFAQPLSKGPNVEDPEDDPEDDPEYNILEDKESDDLADKEELRQDKAVKISKKELNTLIAELFEFEEMYSTKEAEKKKKKAPDNIVVSNQVSNNSMVDLIPTLAEEKLPELVSKENLVLLTIQIQRHIQLMTQHFVMTYKNPQLHSLSTKCKDNLASLKYLCENENSAFNVANLNDALELVDEWENRFEDEKFQKDFENMMVKETETGIQHLNKSLKYIPKFHPEVIQVFLESKALMYPDLLPECPFRPETLNMKRIPYFDAEKRLLALGVTDFWPLVEEKEKKITKHGLYRLAHYIEQYLMPCRSFKALYEQIVKCRSSKVSNAIQTYFNTKQDIVTVHLHIHNDYEVKAPKDRYEELSKTWKNYSDNISKTSKSKKRNLMSLLSESTANIFIGDHLTTPVVHMMQINNKKQKNSNKKGTQQSSVSEDDSDNVESVSNEPSASQLRKTTPRLAKIRSAQNMKMMTQVSGPKNIASCSGGKTREKESSIQSSEESCESSVKGDNEDEIAELMLASTTIKKEPATRKKAKQARESENIKRMLEAENTLGQEERATKFAASFMQKLHLVLESSNPEVLKFVIKTYLEYHEKLEKMSSANSNNKEREESEKEIEKMHDTLTINLYKDICDALHDYPEICTDFLLFLKPHQAAMVNKSVEYTMVQKMSEFINAAQVYFAKQPSRMGKIMQALQQLASDSDVTLEKVMSIMEPVLKGHPHIMTMFQQILPDGKPPECLFAATLFENITCPVLPHDKNKTYTESSIELYENIKLSVLTSQDDVYGGDNCKCFCHETGDNNFKNGTGGHCISCGVRFLNGRVYLQTSEGLRPAKITFPGDNEEQQENIARVSVKSSERTSSLPTSSNKRRKSIKTDMNLEEATTSAAITISTTSAIATTATTTIINNATSNTTTSDNIITNSTTTNSVVSTSNSVASCSSSTSSKQYPSKSPQSDDGDKTVSKLKRGIKSPPKSLDQKRLKLSSESGYSVSQQDNYDDNPSQLKSKREKRAARREAKADSRNLTDDMKSTQNMSPIFSDPEESTNKANPDEEVNIFVSNDESESYIIPDSIEISTHKFQNDDNNEDSKVTRPWSREEDKYLLLQNIEKNYSEDTILSISKVLGDRTPDEVRKRIEILNLLLQEET